MSPRPATAPAAGTDRRRSPWRATGRFTWRATGHVVARVAATALTALLLMSAGLLLAPRVLGGDTLTVLSGSMEPALSPGDAVAVRGTDPSRVCTDVAVGDIVAYLPYPHDPTLVTHRVVAKSVGAYDDGTACRLHTQGDANSARDDPVSPVQVRGIALYAIPHLGHLRQFVGGSPQTLAWVAGGAAVAYGLWTLTRKPTVRVVAVTAPPAPGAEET